MRNDDGDDDDDDDDDDDSKVNNLQTRSKRPEFQSFKSEREDPTYDFSEREKTDGKVCLKTSFCCAMLG